jgi:hypothetical protein
MCLESNFGTKNVKSIIRKLETRVDGYVWLWKVFDVDEFGNLIAQFQDYSFYEGKNTAEGNRINDYYGLRAYCQYEPGFHCFAKEYEAEDWALESRNNYHRDRIVVPVKVKKTWITTVGWQEVAGDVIVCKHIII